MSQQVLHIDLLSILPTATTAESQQLIDEAAALTSIPELLSIGVIEADPEADFDLAIFYVLPDFNALEPFGTNQRYTRFLQVVIAPLLRGLAGADVSLDADFAGLGDYGACLALSAPDQTYDWEIRQLLTDWSGSLNPHAGAVGLAVGERQRYRGLALAFDSQPLPAQKPERRPYVASLIHGKARLLP